MWPRNGPEGATRSQQTKRPNSSCEMSATPESRHMAAAGNHGSAASSLGSVAVSHNAEEEEKRVKVRSIQSSQLGLWK